MLTSPNEQDHKKRHRNHNVNDLSMLKKRRGRADNDIMLPFRDTLRSWEYIYIL